MSCVQKIKYLADIQIVTIMDITPFNEKNTENFKLFSDVPEVFNTIDDNMM